MLGNDKIIVEDIVFVNYLHGNKDNAKYEFSTDYMNRCELIYTLGGDKIIQYGDKTIEETKNTVRFLPNPQLMPKTPKYNVHVINDGDCIVIGFKTSSVLPGEMLAKTFTSASNLEKYFIKMEKLWKFKKYGYYHDCVSVLYNIFSELNKLSSEYRNSRQYKMIEPAIEYLDSHFCDLSIDYMGCANLCRISYTYFVKLFKVHFKMTPNEYITYKKIQFACEMLKTNMYSIKEISIAAGFINEYYFSRVFKKIIGIPPSKYNKICG